MGEWIDLEMELGGEDLVNGDPPSSWYEDEPPPKWKFCDEELYQMTLEEDGSWIYSHLVTENHVFKTFEEAAKAARNLAVKIQATVKIIINQEKELYTIYDPEMKKAIEKMMNNECDYLPEHPLIKLRDEDVLFHENGFAWHFVAHPNGTTESISTLICGCSGDVYCDCFRYSSLEQMSEINLGDTYTIGDRDEILNKALEQAMTEQIKVYVIRKENMIKTRERSFNSPATYVYGNPSYVIFTEEEFKKVLKMGRERQK